MSAPEREEDGRKKTCSSSGLGLAAAAIGVGVGAALYYFLSKRPEERESGASSSENWSYEPQQTFISNINNESYTTDSEHTTTDTSILDDSYQDSSMGESSSQILSSEDNSDTSSNSSYASDTEASSDDEDSFETGYNTLRNSQNTNDVLSDSDTDWDVTDSSLGVPEIQLPSIFNAISHHMAQVFSPRNVRKHRPNHSNNRTSQKFRERSWSLEECSICFEIMLQNQELMSLPCTHRFHVGCIGPWLEAQQTCPNCRKTVE